MNKVPDRKKLRRKYLKKKGKAYAGIGIGAILFIPSLIGLLFCLLILIACGISDPGPTAKEKDVYNRMTPVILLGSACASSAFGLLTYMSIRMMKKAHGSAGIPYVPPVTTATLPAEEVLVRGAEAPAATNETLLRVTTTTQETKAEELLRSTQE